jgi:ferric iron reductase protein FhuF
MFFGLADPAREPAAWQPVSTLYVPRHGGPLDVILESAAVRLGGCEPRVAASLFFQGYASRLLSPQLGCAAVAGCVPEMSPARLCWRRPDTEVIELGMTAGPGWEASPEQAIERIVRTAFDEHLRPLIAALRTRVRLADKLLAGNAAAALIGGLRLLAEHSGPGWTDLAARALAQPYLHGSGRMRDTEPLFVRRSCCLYYRVADGSTCADCPLPPSGQAAPTAPR